MGALNWMALSAALLPLIVVEIPSLVSSSSFFEGSTPTALEEDGACEVDMINNKMRWVWSESERIKQDRIKWWRTKTAWFRGRHPFVAVVTSIHAQISLRPRAVDVGESLTVERRQREKKRVVYRCLSFPVSPKQ
jgi:hypothetical protein